ncbi:AprI/Inh family metalloprotease inhibitor [Pseudovibrio exalbescens]|nr:AprI/Inh family metalloprotease inhibitor [Pseudovibrio exalbescens]
MALTAANAGTNSTKPVGVWRVSDALSSAACVVELRKDPTDNGHGYEFAAWGCEPLRAGLQAATTWRWSHDSGLLIMNEGGSTIAQFDLAELDGLASVFPASHFLVMRPETGTELADLIKKAITITAQR